MDVPRLRGEARDRTRRARDRLRGRDADRQPRGSVAARAARAARGGADRVRGHAPHGAAVPALRDRHAARLAARAQRGAARARAARAARARRVARAGLRRGHAARLRSRANAWCARRSTPASRSCRCRDRRRCWRRWSRAASRPAPSRSSASCRARAPSARARSRRWRRFPGTLVLFEAPNRAAATLARSARARSARGAWRSRASSPSVTKRCCAGGSASSRSTSCAASSRSWSRVRRRARPGRARPQPTSTPRCDRLLAAGLLARATPRAALADELGLARRDAYARVLARAARAGACSETQRRRAGRPRSAAPRPASSITRTPSSRAFSSFEPAFSPASRKLGLLRDRVGDLRARGLEPRLPGRARLGERSGDHEGLARERRALRVLDAPARSGCAGRSRSRVELARGSPDRRATARTASRDRRADLVDGLELVGWRREQARQVGERAREHRRDVLADVADAERVQEARGADVACARSSAATRFCADFSPMRSSAASCSAVSVNRSEGRVTQLRARPAGRPASRRGRRRRARCGWRSGAAARAACAGQLRVRAAQRDLALGAHGARRRRPGSVSGSRYGTVSGGRCSRTTFTTFGITSPARSTNTVSPTRTSSRSISSWLCSVACSTVTPPIRTGSSTATGVSVPVRPTEASMLEHARGLLARRELERDRPARRAVQRAEALLQREARRPSPRCRRLS